MGWQADIPALECRGSHRFCISNLGGDGGAFSRSNSKAVSGHAHFRTDYIWKFLIRLRPRRKGIQPRATERMPKPARERTTCSVGGIVAPTQGEAIARRMTEPRM